MRRSIFYATLTFGAALLPRLYALGTFLTIDEVKWAEGAVQFLGGLLAGDLFQTYWHFFPGITTTWGAALLLAGRCLTAPEIMTCAQAQVENLPQSIGWLRLSPVLLTSAGVAGAYLLLRRLFDHKLALVTTLLLAFDPFFLAHSRILNGDAIAATLMFLSLLAFLLFSTEEAKRRRGAALPGGFARERGSRGAGEQPFQEASHGSRGAEERPFQEAPHGSGGAGEQRSGGAEEQRSRGAGEQRSGGAGEQPFQEASHGSGGAGERPFQEAPHGSGGESVTYAIRNTQYAPHLTLHSSLFILHSSRLTRHASLFLSAIFAGLAALTKLPAPLIGLFIGGLGVVIMVGAWPQEGMTAIRRWLLILLGWGGVAVLTFITLWPAMWVAPLETLRLTYLEAFEIGGAGAGQDTFFLGRQLTDPGPWFYPYVIAFRLTPVTTVGLGLVLIGLVSGGRAALPGGFAREQPFQEASHGSGGASRLSAIRNTQYAPLLTSSLILLVYILFVVLFANLSPKKLDRYVMAIVPPLIFLAAVGLLQAGKWLRTRLNGPVEIAWLTGLVAIQFLSAAFARPYYLDYYNPLLGGRQRAVAQVPVGWGEGLEQAAAYLNRLPNAETLTVSSWYGDMFAPYFVGHRASFADDGRAQLAADYVVFYVNQIQRAKPFPGLVDYFRSNPSWLVLAVEANGQMIEGPGLPLEEPYWVEVYQAPAAQSAGGAPEIEGVAQLLAYQIRGSQILGSRPAGHFSTELAQNEAAVTLFMRVLGPLPARTTFAVSLTPLNSTSTSAGTWQTVAQQGEWQAGHIVEWHGVLTLPAGVPREAYRLRVAFQFEDGSPIAEFAISDNDPLIQLE